MYWTGGATTVIPENLGSSKIAGILLKVHLHRLYSGGYFSFRWSIICHIKTQLKRFHFIIKMRRTDQSKITVNIAATNSPVYGP